MEVRDEIFDAEQMGEQLKKLRNSLRLSQEKFAERLGMSRDTIYNYEKGKTAIPHDLIKRLCQEFNVSADYFYFNKDKPLVEETTIADSFTKVLQDCTDFEKQQLMDMLNIIRKNIGISEGRSVFGSVFFLYNLVIANDQAIRGRKL